MIGKEDNHESYTSSDFLNKVNVFQQKLKSVTPKKSLKRALTIDQSLLDASILKQFNPEQVSQLKPSGKQQINFDLVKEFYFLSLAPYESQQVINKKWVQLKKNVHDEKQLKSYIESLREQKKQITQRIEVKIQKESIVTLKVPQPQKQRKSSANFNGLNLEKKKSAEITQKTKESELKKAILKEMTIIHEILLTGQKLLKNANA